MKSLFKEINNEFDALGIIRSMRSRIIYMIIIIIFTITIASIEAYLMYSTWYGKILFWILITAILSLIISRIVDFYQYKHTRLENKIKMFWIYLEVAEKKFLKNFLKDNDLIFTSTGAIILHLNSDPVLRNFLLKYYEPLKEIDFKQDTRNDLDIATKYHLIFSQMTNQVGLRDNLIIEARKL